MNQQAFSVLFSCLFANTFFHGLQAGIFGFGMGFQASNLAINNFGMGLRAFNGGLRTERSAQPVLDLTLSVLNETLIVKNTTSNKAILIDTKNDVILLLDGSECSGVVISPQQNEATLIPDNLWDAEQQSLIEFLRSIDNEILTLLHKPSCTDFTIPRVQKNILKEIAKIVQDLVVSLDPELEQRPELALELVLSVASGIENLLGGSLDGILVLIGDEQIQLAVDISGVLNILQGVDTINGYLKITAEEAIKNNDNLKISLLLGARDGLVGLSELLRALGEQIDLSPLNDPLGDPETLAKLVAQLGGNSNIGINGAFRVVAEVLALAKNKSSLESVISILIHVVAQSSEVVSDDLNSQLRNSLSNLMEILKQTPSSESLEDIITIVKDLLKEKLIVDGVNVSVIISTILTGIGGPKEKLLNVIITVLKSLSPIVDPSESIPELLLVLMVQLDSASGIRDLISLGINLDSGCACSLLQVALKSIAKVLKKIPKDLYAAISELPIIGDLISALEAALEIENLNLKQLLSESPLIQNLIKGIIQLVSHADLGVDQAQLDQCGEVMESCNGLTVLAGVQVTVTVVVSSN